MKAHLRYTVKFSEKTGKRYAVFANNVDLEMYDEANPKEFAGCRIVCFDGYDNAFELRDEIDNIIEAPYIHADSMTINGPLAAKSLTIGNVIEIDLASGAITRLPGFTTTDAAALAFWGAVERLAPKHD